MQISKVLRSKRFQEWFGAAVIAGALVGIGCDIGKRLKKKEEQ